MNSQISSIKVGVSSVFNNLYVVFIIKVSFYLGVIVFHIISNGWLLLLSGKINILMVF